MKDFMPARTTSVRRNQETPVDHDYKGVVVVASAWLLFYAVMLSGLLTERGRDLLASISDLLGRS